MDFKNKVVLVTGSSRGIGASTVKEFASLGANVVINYNHSLEEAKKVEEEIKKYNVEYLVIKCDISNEKEIDNMIDNVINKFGKIDILVNNAAIDIPCLFQDKTKDNFMKILETNLVGTFLISKKIGQIMYEQQSGNIINITSTNGINKNYPMTLDYDASKSGIISLTHNLSMQFAPYVRVNAIAPGWVATESEIKDLDAEYIKQEEEKIYLKRFAKPEEITNVIIYLSSNKSSYINNTVIRVDGGTY